MTRSVSDILQSTSDVLFPAGQGRATVSLDSTGPDGDTPLHVVIWRDDTPAALLLIARGAPLDAAGDMGETPLHVAIGRKNPAVIRALVAAGARMDIVSEFGQTAREKARACGIALD